MKRKVIVLDLDGTLVETNINWDLVREKVRRILGVNRNVCLKPLATMVMRFRGLGWRFREALKVIEEAELESVGSAKYYAGTRRLLEKLKRCGYGLILVTLRSWRTTKPLLDHMGIDGLFDLVITRDNVADRRLQLLLVLERLRVDVEEVIFIGDNTIDLEVGRSLGIMTIIVGSYMETVEKLKDLLRKCTEKSTSLG